VAGAGALVLAGHLSCSADCLLGKFKLKGWNLQGQVKTVFL
jgi:hypothetical protein